MEVYAKDKKMTKLLTNAVAIQKKYGAICGLKIQQRLNELRNAANLAEIASMKHLQFHSLQGDRVGAWSIKVHTNNKMTFIRAIEPVVYLKDGSIDLSAVTAIEIIDPCVDYH